MKVVALGVNYFYNSWNLLDFTVVVISLVSTGISATSSGSGGGLSALRALRAVRALRPMRVAARSEGMKVGRCRFPASKPVLKAPVVLALFTITS